MCEGEGVQRRLTHLKSRTQRTLNPLTIQKQTVDLSSNYVCIVLLAHLVPVVEAQVLVTLFTVMVGIVSCIFGELNPARPPAQEHLLLAHRVSFARTNNAVS